MKCNRESHRSLFLQYATCLPRLALLKQRRLHSTVSFMDRPWVCSTFSEHARLVDPSKVEVIDRHPGNARHPGWHR
jgi:hypothetical protein